MQDSSYTTVPLYRRDGTVVATATISPADAPLVMQYRWHRDVRGYARRNDVVGVMMHRVVLGLKQHDGRFADHINGDPLDNRRENLRVVTPAENSQNRRANSNATSRFRGVQWDGKKGLWRVRPNLNGQRFNVGYFKDEVEAARAAEAWRQENMPFAQPDAELARLAS
jgi:hypothetical protein